MRTWITHGTVAAALGIAICLPAAPVCAEHEEPASSPAGEEGANDPLPSEPDPLFDEDFDAELELLSDVARADPFENTNRKIFAFNQGLQTVIFGPVTSGYRFLLPELARKGIRRVFLNMNSPKIFVNDLLQLRFKDAAHTLGRCVLNSTLGLGGLFDAGKAAGWERHEADFGQTLAKVGVGSGPYLMLPIFGPSTVRDGLGSVVDLAFQPLTYILGPAELIVQIYIGSGNSLAALDASYDKLEALEESSVDFYAAMRSAYLQSRRAAVEEHAKPSAVAVGGDAEIAAEPTF